jgi:general secretion pathway protein F
MPLRPHRRRGIKPPLARARRETYHAGGIRLSNAQVILFTDELADFLHSGLQLEPALQLMENREERSPSRTCGLSAGKSARRHQLFRGAQNRLAEFRRALLQPGRGRRSQRRAGALLRRQAVHLVAMQDLRSRVKLALIYPAALVLAGTGAMVVFMTVLVPQMTKLFAKTGSSMPLPTYMLIQLSS